jgi:hypothetical protein
MFRRSAKAVPSHFSETAERPARQTPGRFVASEELGSTRFSSGGGCCCRVSRCGSRCWRPRRHYGQPGFRRSNWYSTTGSGYGLASKRRRRRVRAGAGRACGPNASPQRPLPLLATAASLLVRALYSDGPGVRGCSGDCVYRSTNNPKAVSHCQPCPNRPKSWVIWGRLGPSKIALISPAASEPLAIY